jgi:hypothetical protein
MQVWLIVAAGVLVVAVLVWFFLIPGNADTTMETIIPNAQSGKSETTPSAHIFRSFNHPDGAVFTYAFWMSVSDFTFNYGHQRPILSKGNCPGVYLDSTSNALLVKVNTYGGGQESILIPNIPAQKWIHVVVEVNQYSLSVFINGILRQTHTLNQLPLQNTDSLVVGSNQQGWDGTISELTYYARTLKPEEIEKLASKQPSASGFVPVMPPYSDLGWYIGPFKSA